MPAIRFILFLCLFNRSYSQGVSNINTDRPDQTESPFIVPKGFLQFENGFVVVNDKNGTEITKETILPSSLIKQGLSTRFELRVILEASKLKTKNQGIENIAKGLNPVQVGFKVNFIQEKGIIPMTSLIVHSSIPKAASADKIEKYYAANFRFLMQHTLSKRVSFSYNLGSEWDGFTNNRSDIYTVTSGISLNEKVGFYLEFYGFISKHTEADHRFDAGITYLIKPNILFDVSAGIGLTPVAPNSFIGCGLSFRVPR